MAIPGFDGFAADFSEGMAGKRLDRGQGRPHSLLWEEILPRLKEMVHV